MSDIFDVEEFYQEINKVLSSYFPKYFDILFTPPPQENIGKIPMVVVELPDFEVQEEDPSGEVVLYSMLEIRIIIGRANKEQGPFKNAQCNIMARNASLNLVKLFHKKIVYKNCWPLKFGGSHDDQIDYKIKDVESWVSYFKVQFYAGENLWDNWDSLKENIEIFKTKENFNKAFGIESENE